jgi:hypothetical protein
MRLLTTSQHIFISFSPLNFIFLSFARAFRAKNKGGSEIANQRALNGREKDK